MFRSHLKFLNVTNCGFTLDGAYAFLGILGKNHTVETVIFDKNDLKGHKLRQRVLKDIFVNNRTLKSISMNYCNIGETGAQQISQGLGLSPVLLNLSMSHNNICDQGAEYLTNPFFFENFSLESFNLSSNKITDKGMRKLLEGLNRNRTLRSLDLQDNQLSEASVSKLTPFVKLNTKLVKLNLDNNICKIRVIEELNSLIKKNGLKIE